MSELFEPVDEHDWRIAIGATGLLATFNEAGLLTSSDLHVATRVGALGGESDERVLLAVALAVRAVRRGSVCLDLATVAATAPELPWPEEWPVAGSPLVHAGVVRFEHGLLYLDRYHRLERQVHDDLAARRARRRGRQRSSGSGRAGEASAGHFSPSQRDAVSGSALGRPARRGPGTTILRQPRPPARRPRLPPARAARDQAPVRGRPEGWDVDRVGRADRPRRRPLQEAVTTELAAVASSGRGSSAGRAVSTALTLHGCWVGAPTTPPGPSRRANGHDDVVVSTSPDGRADDDGGCSRRCARLRWSWSATPSSSRVGAGAVLQRPGGRLRGRADSPVVQLSTNSARGGPQVVPRAALGRSRQVVWACCGPRRRCPGSRPPTRPRSRRRCAPTRSRRPGGLDGGPGRGPGCGARRARPYRRCAPPRGPHGIRAGTTRGALARRDPVVDPKILYRRWYVGRPLLPETATTTAHDV